MEFEYKTYRCEWIAEVFTVDQYGQRSRFSEVWWNEVCPTKEKATQALHSVTKEGYPRRIYPGAEHTYYDSGVFYREVLCHTYFDNHGDC